MLISELDKKLKITKKLSQCFRDYRNSSYVEYSIHQLLAQRVYGIILGYEDVNDHHRLPYDPALATALEKVNFFDSNTPILAGKSTLNRLEYCPETMLDPETNRYHKIEAIPEEIEKSFVDIFLQRFC